MTVYRRLRVLKKLNLVQGSMVIDDSQCSAKIWRLRFKTPQNLHILFSFAYYFEIKYFILVLAKQELCKFSYFKKRCVQYKVVIVIDDSQFSSKIWRLRLKTTQILHILFSFTHSSILEYFISVLAMHELCKCYNFTGSYVQYKVV